jgi:hypothetical protein
MVHIDHKMCIVWSMKQGILTFNLTLKSTLKTISTICFNIKIYILPIQCIHVFCIILTTKNSLFP